MIEILYVYPGYLSYDEWTIAYPPLGGMGIEIGFKITTDKKVSSVEFYLRAKESHNNTIPPEKPSKRDSHLAMVKVYGSFEKTNTTLIRWLIYGGMVIPPNFVIAQTVWSLRAWC